MEKLISNGVSHETVPESYILPLEKRPGKLVSAHNTAIPVIDLRGGTALEPCNRREVMEQIMKAGKEFGFFQVINHGVPAQVMDDMLGVAEEFFKMSMEDKVPYYSQDPYYYPKDSSIKPRLFTSTGLNNDEKHYWRDCLKLACYPVEEFIHHWPEKPSKFRESLASYSVETKELALRLLKLIGEGLGFEEEYFDGDLSGGKVTILVNHYAPCPDPSLTLGLPGHCDPNLITLLLQGDVSGLEVFHEVGWMGVEPIPNAFVVNFGHQLEFITNGMLRSVEHRVVTNSATARTTVVTFITPTLDCPISPGPSTIYDFNPPIYRSFTYQEFYKTYLTYAGDRKGTMEDFMEQFMIRNDKF